MSPAEWAAFILRIAARPTFPELSARRWGPNGRERFADPRPEDRYAAPGAAA